MSGNHQVSRSLRVRVPTTAALDSSRDVETASPSVNLSIIEAGVNRMSPTSSHSSPGTSLASLSSTSSPPALSSPSDGDSSDHSQSAHGAEHHMGEGRPASFQHFLFNALVDPRGCPKSKRFFPNTVFAELIDERVVQRELKCCLQYLDPAETRRLAQVICGPRSFKKVFALLALVDRLSNIIHFIEQSVTDDDLPLSKVALPDSNLFTLGCRIGPRNRLETIACLDRWNPATIRMFEEWQWSTLAPTFQCGENKNIKHMYLPDDVPLPFTADSQYDTGTKVIQGGYSTVFKVAIHPAHHSFHGSENASGNNNFAVKRLLSRNKTEFDREVEMLMTYSGNAHPHLISLLATYEQYGEYCLVFPWAESDLQSFWSALNPHPSMNHGTVLWMAQQCLGIAQGLSVLHKHKTVNPSRLKSAFAGHQPTPHQMTETQVWPLFGVHGDIKPPNILYFENDSTNGSLGTLKISDFGLAEFKTSATKIYRPSSKIAVSASYRPPECELKSGRVGQSQDIWALGCLYLEMAAWLLGGWELVQSFQLRRAANEGFSYYGNVADSAFFQIESVAKDGTATVTVKPAVTEFINHLRSLPSCTEHLNSFLDLIQTEMLILKPTKQCERGRIGAIELVSKLNRMWQKCEDAKFATTPVAQRKSKRSVDCEEPSIASVKRRQR